MYLVKKLMKISLVRKKADKLNFIPSKSKKLSDEEWMNLREAYEKLNSKYQ